MTLVDWSENAFFDAPERPSVDGGTTSYGDLWHEITPRWGHSLHAMCSYHGMFPAKVAHYFIQHYSKPGDIVLDPFSGRGTTALQARIDGRRAVCNDLSPLAYVLSRAKANPPAWDDVNTFLNELEASFRRTRPAAPDVSPDIRMLFHEQTLSQLCFVRSRLLSKNLVRWSRNEFMIAGALAGIMHGSWRRDGSSQYLSISMPNTFSMSPAYVARYIRENGLETLEQNVFDRLRDKLARLYRDGATGDAGAAYHVDAVELLTDGRIRNESVGLVLTSPPYLRVVNYATSNWIRLWLLGVDGAGRDQGVGRKRLNAALDHQHTYSSYCQFMLRVFRGLQRVLTPDGVGVVVVGDVADPGKTPMPLAARLWRDLKVNLDLQLIDLIEDDLPAQNKVSRIWGSTKGKATDRDCALILGRTAHVPFVAPGAVDWAEPYKDGGPDAAHDRLYGLKQTPRH